MELDSESTIDDLWNTLRSAITRDRFIYTSCYCEENIYLTVQELKTNPAYATYALIGEGRLELHPIFVINPTKAVSLILIAPSRIGRTGRQRSSILL